MDELLDNDLEYSSYADTNAEDEKWNR
jgi:hypothetical protein